MPGLLVGGERPPEATRSISCHRSTFVQEAFLTPAPTPGSGDGPPSPSVHSRFPWMPEEPVSLIRIQNNFSELESITLIFSAK